MDVVRRWSTLGPLVLALLPMSLAAQPSERAPPGDGLVADLISLIQTGDPSRRGTFLAATLAPSVLAADSARLDRLLATLHEDGAPFEVVATTPSGPHVLIELRSPRARRVATLVVSADERDVGKLGRISVLRSAPTVLDSIHWPSEPLGSDTAVARVVRENLERLARADAFSGAVHVAAGDSVLLAAGFGLADEEHDVPNTPTTRFAIASMGKMFTATAVLQLVDAGRLRLDDTLGHVLPDYPAPERAASITIRHLLEHTAGLGDLWSTPERPMPHLTGELAVAGAVAHAPLLFEPGSRWAYSNEGYVVLAAVVEHISGESFPAYLERHVFAPAGMRETVLSNGPDEIVPRRAVGYRARPDDPLGIGAPQANWSVLGTYRFNGAGGGYTTVGDLARFGRALRSGALVSPDLRDAMWTGRWPIPGYDDEMYGWGSFVADVDGHLVVGHGGGGMGSGMDNGFRQFADGRYTVVVLSNMDPPMATDLTRALVRFLATQAEAAPRAGGASPAAWSLRLQVPPAGGVTRSAGSTSGGQEGRHA